MSARNHVSAVSVNCLILRGWVPLRDGAVGVLGCGVGPIPAGFFGRAYGKRARDACTVQCDVPVPHPRI